LTDFFNQLLFDLQHSSWWERIAVVTGILSVWFSKKENILVYPFGLINTIIYVWLSFKGDLIGEAAVNFYYTTMSIYGWILWSRKDSLMHPVVSISFSNKKWWQYQLVFFSILYFLIFFLLTYLKKDFAPGAIPWADAFASATAFTGMWMMTKKKIESWYWWIATNIASIPLYFVKGYALTSVYYLVLLVMAVFGLLEWMKKAKQKYA